MDVLHTCVFDSSMMKRVRMRKGGPDPRKEARRRVRRRPYTR